MIKFNVDNYGDGNIEFIGRDAIIADLARVLNLREIINKQNALYLITRSNVDFVDDLLLKEQERLKLWLETNGHNEESTP